MGHPDDEDDILCHVLCIIAHFARDCVAHVYWKNVSLTALGVENDGVLQQTSMST